MIFATDLAADKALDEPTSLEGALHKAADLIRERAKSGDCESFSDSLIEIDAVTALIAQVRNGTVSEAAFLSDHHKTLEALDLTETRLAEWLSDNTEDVFEEEFEIDIARSFVFEATGKIDALRTAKAPAP